MMLRALVAGLLVSATACSRCDAPEMGAPTPVAPAAPMVETAATRSLRAVRFGVSLQGDTGRVSDFMLGVEAAFAAHASQYPGRRHCELFAMQGRGRLSSMAENLAFLREHEHVDILLDSDLLGWRQIRHAKDWLHADDQDDEPAMAWMQALRADVATEVAWAIEGLCATGVQPAAIAFCIERSAYGEAALRAGLAALAARHVAAAQVRRTRIDPLQPEPERCLFELEEQATHPVAVVLAASQLASRAFLRSVPSDWQLRVVCTSAVSPEDLSGLARGQVRLGVISGVMPTAGSEVARWLPDMAGARTTTAAMREGFLAGRLLANAFDHLPEIGFVAFRDALAAMSKSLAADAGFMDQRTGKPGLWLVQCQQDSCQRTDWARLFPAEGR